MFHHEEFRIFEKRNKRYKKLGRERFAEEIRKYKQKNKRKKNSIEQTGSLWHGKYVICSMKKIKLVLCWH